MTDKTPEQSPPETPVTPPATPKEQSSDHAKDFVDQMVAQAQANDFRINTRYGDPQRRTVIVTTIVQGNPLAWVSFTKPQFVALMRDFKRVLKGME